MATRAAHGAVPGSCVRSAGKMTDAERERVVRMTVIGVILCAALVIFVLLHLH